MAELSIGERSIGPADDTFIIAEAGSNHNGDFEQAKRLIDAASEAGADAVKFQTFRADKMYPADSGGIGTADTDAYELLKNLEMPYHWIPDLGAYAEEQDIYFLSSPFDEESAALLDPHVPAYKVGSTLLSHHPFLQSLAEKEKPLIISTGAHEMSEVRDTMSILADSEVEVVLLQCVSSYPTPVESANLSVIETFRQEFDVPVGLSDHTEEPTLAPVVAVSLGAAVIEKHLTLDKTLEGPDHSFALEPHEFDELVSRVRMAEAALGDGQKTVLGIEQETYENGRRCLHATSDISEGDTLTEENTEWLRPGENPRGIPPKEAARVLGMQAAHNLSKGDAISRDDISESTSSSK